jgi:hypothetical protein
MYIAALRAMLLSGSVSCIGFPKLLSYKLFPAFKLAFICNIGFTG